MYIRIPLFYLGGTFLIGLLVPSNNGALNLEDSTAAKSPFVIAIKAAGIGGLPHVINAAILTSAWSAGSSDLYTASRAIYGLAVSGNAPRIFAQTRSGLPLPAIVFSASFGFLAYMSVNSGSGTVFKWFSNLAAIAGLLTWFGIAVTYLRFRKGMIAQDFDLSRLPYRNKLNPYAAWYVAIACPLISLVSQLPARVLHIHVLMRAVNSFREPLYFSRATFRQQHSLQCICRSFFSLSCTSL